MCVASGVLCLIRDNQMKLIESDIKIIEDNLDLISSNASALVGEIAQLQSLYSNKLRRCISRKNISSIAKKMKEVSNMAGEIAGATFDVTLECDLLGSNKRKFKRALRYLANRKGNSNA
jgi:hypothetical protein